MTRKTFFIVGIGLVLTACLGANAQSQDYSAGFSSETKYGGADVRVHRLASDIAYTLERAKLVSASLRTNAHGRVSASQGTVRVYHATAMRKMQQLRGLLAVNSELRKTYASLLKALEHASELDRSRESQDSGVKEDERGDDYWDERLSEIETEVLPSILSYMGKYAGPSRRGAAGSTDGE